MGTYSFHDLEDNHLHDIAKYVESKIGRYPALPIVDGEDEVHDMSIDTPPGVELLIANDKIVLNHEVHRKRNAHMEENRLNKEDYISKPTLRARSESREVFRDLIWRPDSDYPADYIKMIEDAKKMTKKL